MTWLGSTKLRRQFMAAAALTALSIAMLAGYATTATAETGEGCRDGDVTIDRAIDGGASANCERIGPSEFRLTISPEDSPPINCSPWYAFRLRNFSASPAQVRVTLEYTACEHRYTPKVSADGQSWQPLPRESVRLLGDTRREVSMDLTLTGPELLVAAQEIIGAKHYADQISKFAKVEGVRKVEFGKSLDGRPIEGMMVHSGPNPAREQVLLIGRQHPPEVTGALAMDSFLDAMMSNDPIAKAYRARYETYVIPLLNPDGVARGYWRHNAGGKDLNRDWDKFTQPETRAVGQLMTIFDRDPNRNLRLLVDFHSTHRDLFYTIPDELPTDPPFVARDWMARLKARMPEYEPDRESEHDPRLPTAKTQTYVRYQIPTATFEIGDRTDRSLIRRLGYEAALALMETMLASPRPGDAVRPAE